MDEKDKSKKTVWSGCGFSVTISENDAEKPTITFGESAVKEKPTVTFKKSAEDENPIYKIGKKIFVDENRIYSWGIRSLYGFVVGIPVSFCIVMAIPCGMFIVLYVGWILILFATSVIGTGAFYLMGKHLEIQNVLVKSIVMGIVGYSLYYFLIYNSLYSGALQEGGRINDPRWIHWKYTTCAMHVAMSTFVYVLSVMKGNRDKILLIGLPIVLMFCFHWFGSFGHLLF